MGKLLEQRPAHLRQNPPRPTRESPYKDHPARAFTPQIPKSRQNVQIAARHLPYRTRQKYRFWRRTIDLAIWKIESSQFCDLILGKSS